ncbi:hypothetical protein [Amycolatopsis sp. ATCC 39116]|uniref:hypothetical protein n=1 Tax=Amycolatopsis sp. (strain ATCC 39116 / 75iv2) TaxID=385957 RepID=UPI0002625570|nr:hypothetical protein [Amycolatopsis sp. ATCC 39116]
MAVEALEPGHSASSGACTEAARWPDLRALITAAFTPPAPVQDPPADGDDWIRYADDVAAGDRFDLGEFTVCEDDIIALGER